jgi:hypothetical protein
MTEICVPWKSQSNVWWNETCARIIEHFGLPGNRYTTEVSADDMKFFFVNDKDAFMCRIMISEEL